jgi:hypothetical protein
MTTERSKFEADAYALGVEAAKTAASWCTDGNTSDEHYARMIRWFDDGDPQVSDYLPTRPNLSGEWADAPTLLSLAADVTSFRVEHIAPEILDAIADAWEAGVADTFETECERLIRAQLPDDSTCGACGHTWNSVLAPTPASRCPNEYEHGDDDA